MHKRRMALAALLALVALGGCGPKIDEIGVAVLLSAPAVYLTVHLLLYGLSRLWRRRYPRLRHPLKVWLIAPAVALAILAPIVGPVKDIELVGMAYWVFGTSYLTMTLALWRLWFAFDEELSFTHAQAPVAALCSVAALGCILKLHHIGDLAVAMFILPGYGGMISGPLYLVLLVEALIRGRAPSRPSPARHGA